MALFGDHLLPGQGAARNPEEDMKVCMLMSMSGMRSFLLIGPVMALTAICITKKAQSQRLMSDLVFFSAPSMHTRVTAFMTSVWPIPVKMAVIHDFSTCPWGRSCTV